MEFPIEEWAAAVRQRHARRRYTGEPIPAEKREAMRAHCEGFAPFEGVRVAFVAEPSADIFGGILGSYGSIRKAPSVLVFIADTGVDEHQLKLGYTGEAAVLEATRLGLGTCWVAGFFDRRRTKRLVELGPAERVLAVSPLGIAEGEPKLHDRKPLPEVAPGIDKALYPAWAFEGVTLARLAPSALNRQPWVFRVDETGIVMSVDREGRELGVSKRLDCGIAMLHFELGALTTGGFGGWELLPAPDVARYRLLEQPE